MANIPVSAHLRQTIDFIFWLSQSGYIATDEIMMAQDATSLMITAAYDCTNPVVNSVARASGKSDYPRILTRYVPRLNSTWAVE